MRQVLLMGLGSLILFNSCAPRHELPPLGPSDKILAFGNSITFGTGVSEQRDYPSLLEARIGRRVIQGGVPGELTAEGLQRLPRWLDQVRPSLLILCHGGNDLLAGDEMHRIAENIRRMVQLARDRHIEVLLIGVPRPGIFLRAAPFYREIAREYSIPYEGKVLAKILSDPLLKADTVHPNEEGYQVLAEAIATLLEESGAIQKR